LVRRPTITGGASGGRAAANQVGATTVVAHDLMTREYTIKEEGYVFMYVSNENATLVDVYFDDVVMTHTKGNVVQYNEYYPFGMQTSNSWTRENTTGNNFLGNGGTELNTTSNLYDLAYRNYDPILGRMNQIDPMATKYASLTPYNFSFNDPVTFTDPSGADPEYGITRYTYDDRVDHYRGQFYSGGSTSALRFHTGGRSGGFTNWSYAPSFGQLVQMRNDARSLSVVAYVQKYGFEVWEQGRNYLDNDGNVEFHHQYYFLKSISQQQQQQTNGGGSGDPKPAEYGLGFQLSIGLGLTKGTELSIGGWSGGPGSRGQAFFSIGTATKKVYLNAGGSAQIELLRSRSGPIDVSGKGKSWSAGGGPISGAYSHGFNSKTGDVAVDVIGAGVGFGLPASVGLGVETKTWTFDFWSPFLITPLVGFGR